MNNIQKIVKVDNNIIYQNKLFWYSTLSTEILYNFSAHNIKDYFNEDVSFLDYSNAYKENRLKLEESKGNLTNQIKINIDIGNEFISLFREEFIKTPLTSINSIELSMKLNSVIPLILTGSFREACDVLTTITPDEFLTEERIQKYIDLLHSADNIDYNFYDEDYNPEYFMTDTFDVNSLFAEQAEENETNEEMN